MEGLILCKMFRDINLDDVFFNSLKSDYQGFEDWFRRKSDEKAFVLYNESNSLEAFLYLKIEEGPIRDVQPQLDFRRVLKIGTLKINPHGTRLGERFIKRALDLAINQQVEGLYVTVFQKHVALVELFRKYGFIVHGEKGNMGDKELVLWKSLSYVRNDLLLDYPRVSTHGKNKYLLSIYPEFHTRLFPDSILRNERFDNIEDISHTNSIHKTYISFAPDVDNLQRGDILVIYRTSDGLGPAKYRSVATSICIVEEVMKKKDFLDLNHFIDYCSKFSVFTIQELSKFYRERKRLTVIKMTYNIALRKRLTREKLIGNVGINGADRWTFIGLTDQQFYSILVEGDTNESLIIN